MAPVYENVGGGKMYSLKSRMGNLFSSFSENTKKVGNANENTKKGIFFKILGYGAKN